MTRSWIRKALIGAAVGAVAVAALVGTTALANIDDGTVLVGVSAIKGPAMVHKLVTKTVNAPYVAPPGPLPDDPPPKQIGMALSPAKGSVQGTGVAGLNLGGAVGLISQTPEMRLEKSLKDLAHELR
ncbi:MAG TPA: hypothetical protein VJ826_07930 [Candidatus Polarisedimenticolaceae bacterium]|nr:hypothetical protein [Candidatus Polarisedimenticolaceae bacterium]